MTQLDKTPQTDSLAVFAPDRGRYWRDHAIMAVVFMALAGGVLVMIDAPAPAIGALGAILAVGVRAWYLASEVLDQKWTLTKTALLAHQGQLRVPLASVVTVRPFLGGVQIITRGGDKHLIKHLANPQAVAQRINDAR